MAATLIVLFAAIGASVDRELEARGLDAEEWGGGPGPVDSRQSHREFYSGRRRNGEGYVT